MMRIPFRKMHGLGNDFVLLDERGGAFGLGASEYARIADRRFGIGCDQVLVLSPAQRAGAIARYSIYNADGSRAEHCGNGIRCVARYLRETDGADTALRVEIGDDAYELTFTENDDVRVDMGVPEFEPARIPIRASAAADRYRLVVGETEIEFGAVSMGNPHAVLRVDDVDDAPVERIGAALQVHEFFPARVNVGFAQILDRAHVRLRVFERGVGETFACGTGACAAVAVARRWGIVDNDVAVALCGGTLRISWRGGDKDHLWMTGPASSVFEGIIEL